MATTNENGATLTITCTDAHAPTVVLAPMVTDLDALNNIMKNAKKTCEVDVAGKPCGKPVTITSAQT